MDNGTNMYMPVAPAYNYGNSGFGGSWGGDGWWIILFLFALMGNSFGGWGGFGLTLLLQITSLMLPQPLLLLFLKDVAGMYLLKMYQNLLHLQHQLSQF